MKFITAFLTTALLGVEALAFAPGSEVAVSCPKRGILLAHATLIATNACTIVVSNKAESFTLDTADTVLSQPKPLQPVTLPSWIAPAQEANPPTAVAEQTSASAGAAPSLPQAIKVHTYGQKIAAGIDYINIRPWNNDPVNYQKVLKTGKPTLNEFFDRHPELANQKLGTYWIFQFPDFFYRPNDFGPGDKAIIVDNNYNYNVLAQKEHAGPLEVWPTPTAGDSSVILERAKDGKFYRAKTAQAKAGIVPGPTTGGIPLLPPAPVVMKVGGSLASSGTVLTNLSHSTR
jgi:hypothetical protein